MSMMKLLRTCLFAASILPGSALLADGPSGTRLTGKIETLPASGAGFGNWIVAGRTLQVTAQTKIEYDNGPAVAGACVEVKGNAVNATTIAATSIVTRPPSKCTEGAPSNMVEIFGAVERLPANGVVGDWLVAGTIVRVTAQTKIEQDGGPVAIGACAEVKGTRSADNSLAASKIEVSSGIGGCRPDSSDNEKELLEFRGSIQSAPLLGSQIWTISGRRVLVNSATTMSPMGRTLAVGNCVEIKGRLENDNSVTASRVQILGSGVCTNGSDSQSEVNFFGPIMVLPSGGLVGDWTVGAMIVSVTPGTRFESEGRIPAVGVCVEVKGSFAGTTVAASRISIKPGTSCPQSTGVYRFEGSVEAFPAGGTAGAWRIGGRNVITDSSTVFDVSSGAVALGACAAVSGALQPDSSVRATRIEVLSTSGSCIFSGGIVSAGNLSGTAVSAGGIISIFGNHIGPATSLPLTISNGQVSSRLANTRVLFDGTPATLLFVSQGQINAIVPCNVAGKTSVRVQVESNGAWTNIVTLPVQESTPSIFTLASSGAGPGAILNTNYSLNSAANATARGDTAILFGTGEGQTNAACSDGAITSLVGPFPFPLGTVSVEVGGRPATVLYAGGAPGLVRGVVQVNFTLAADTPVGPAVPVVMKIGTRTSQSGVTMAVR